MPKTVDVLIVCPKNLLLNWMRELNKWLVNKSLTIGIADTSCVPTTNIILVNPDILGKLKTRLEKRMWDLIIVDEAHAFSNPKAQRTKALFGHKPSKKEQAEGIEFSSGLPCKRKLAMTGTPLRNRPMEIQPILAWLDRERWGNAFKFGLRYADAHQTKFGWDFTGSSNLDELQRLLRETCMVRRLKKDVLTELPAKRRQVILLDSEDYAEAIQAERDVEKSISGTVAQIAKLHARAELAKAESDAAYKEAVASLESAQRVSFSEVSRVRHETALAKLPACWEWTDNLLQQTDKLVICAHHRDVIEATRAHYADMGAVMIYGGMDTTDSQAAKDRFQNDPTCRVMVLSILVAVGLTLTAASNVAFYELDWVPGNVSQAEDRCHRIGQKDSVNVFHLVLDGSMDAKMAGTIVAKQEVLDAALDNPLKVIEASAPVTPGLGQSVTVTRKAIDEEAAKLTPRQVELIHGCLRRLAGMCDGARVLDGSGFNKVDAEIGHSLAERPCISARQAVIGLRLVRKYRRQLGEDTVAGILKEAA